MIIILTNLTIIVGCEVSKQLHCCRINRHFECFVQHNDLNKSGCSTVFSARTTILKLTCITISQSLIPHLWVAKQRHIIKIVHDFQLFEVEALGWCNYPPRWWTLKAKISGPIVPWLLFFWPYPKISQRNSHGFFASPHGVKCEIPTAPVRARGGVERLGQRAALAAGTATDEGSCSWCACLKWRFKGKIMGNHRKSSILNYSWTSLIGESSKIYNCWKGGSLEYQ